MCTRGMYRKCIAAGDIEYSFIRIKGHIPRHRQEPTDPDDRLLKLDNFVYHPPIAGWTAESVLAEAAIIAENLYRLKQGKVLRP
jgi:hypothetical protein